MTTYDPTDDHRNDPIIIAPSPRPKRLSISAIPDGASSYLVLIDDLDTGAQQSFELEADSEEDAINRTIDAINAGVREAFGDTAHVDVGELEYD